MVAGARLHQAQERGEIAKMGTNQHAEGVPAANMARRPGKAQ